MWQPGLWALKVTSPASPRFRSHKPPSCRPWRQNIAFLCFFWPLPKSLEITSALSMICHRFWDGFGIHFGSVFIFVLFLFWTRVSNVCLSDFPLILVPLNIQNVKLDLRKTDNYLNLPFFEQLETIMISSSIFASFRQHLSWFSWVFRYLIYLWIVRDFWHRFWLHCGILLDYIGILFASFFDLFAFLFRKGIFWRCLLHYGTLLAPFCFPFGPRLTPLRLVFGPSGLMSTSSLTFSMSIVALVPSASWFFKKENAAKRGPTSVQNDSKTVQTNWARN